MYVTFCMCCCSVNSQRISSPFFLTVQLHGVMVFCGGHCWAPCGCAGLASSTTQQASNQRAAIMEFLKILTLLTILYKHVLDWNKILYVLWVRTTYKVQKKVKTRGKIAAWCCEYSLNKINQLPNYIIRTIYCVIYFQFIKKLYTEL